ncbi:hypothetical protein TCAL_17349 [Tigriopus californicus]|uniref:C2H2-type domain-containing protein n=1 Tax=Tigriopus californicus TaxID=6832 RepID=A0A553NKS3_TIGCA|nr:hypothetical protein TCAL_17349 [Tigriopus californicus]
MPHGLLDNSWYSFPLTMSTPSPLVPNPSPFPDSREDLDDPNVSAASSVATPVSTVVASSVSRASTDSGRLLSSSSMPLARPAEQLNERYRCDRCLKTFTSRTCARAHQKMKS